MTAATQLGEAYRKLGALISVRAVRDDDAGRASRRTNGDGFAKRVAAIKAEVEALEKFLNN